MKNQSYTTSFTVDQSPEEVFDAINNVRGWWSEEIDGRTHKLGAVFEYHYKDLHRSTQKITELARGTRVVWHVVEGFLNFVKDKTEWSGTEVVFDITRKDDKTELRFTHKSRDRPLLVETVPLRASTIGGVVEGRSTVPREEYDAVCGCDL